MTKPTLSVHILDVPREGIWQFRDSSLQWRHHVHGSVATFDPFPAYPHDAATVRRAVKRVTRSVPPLWNVDCFLANREEVSRSNGHSNIHESGHYGEGNKYTKDAPTGLIVLSGKRIPPHPAMTRYLIGHEYGHNVQWMLSHLRGYKGFWNDELLRDYLKARGLPEDHLHPGHGGVWHRSAGEIFACDFRILVAGIEPKMWPHPGITHAHNAPQSLHDWWLAAHDELRQAKGVSFG